MTAALIDARVGDMLVINGIRTTVTDVERHDDGTFTITSAQHPLPPELLAAPSRYTPRP
jgi:hypothetical protein